MFPQAAPIGFAQARPLARGSRMESVLVGLLALLGLLVTLHRNGVVHALLGPGASASLESALGGPGFGTPAAVEALVKKTPAQK